jgi:hypothetical protein
MNKGGTLDLEYYQGAESMRLGDSIIGAPLGDWIWLMADGWSVTLAPAHLRERFSLQCSPQASGSSCGACAVDGRHRLWIHTRCSTMGTMSRM